MPNGQIVSVLGKLCIGSKGDAGTDGGMVALWKCDEADDSTKWQVHKRTKGVCWINKFVNTQKKIDDIG